MTATKDDITKYTKPELIKALRAAWAREARLAKKIEKLQGTQAAPPPLHPGPYDVVHVTQGQDTASELVPTFCGLCNIATKPPSCEVKGCPHAWQSEPVHDDGESYEFETTQDGLAAFPWEQK